MKENHLLKWTASAFLSGIMLYPTFAQASGLDVVEVVNFKCPHCRHFDRYVPDLAALVTAHGGTYRMAPVEPALKNDPAISVRFWYALDDISGDKVADEAAKYIYLGYQKGATLNSVSGIYSWLQDYMTNLPGITKLRKGTYSKEVIHQWKLALAYTRLFPTTKVPEFICINPETYNVVYKLQRNKTISNADLLYKNLTEKLEAGDASEQQITRLPWLANGSVRE